MDSGLGSSSIEDVAAIEAPTVVVPDQTGQQQVPVSCQMAMTEGGDCLKCGEMRSLDEGLVEELNMVFERRLRIVEQHGNDIHCKIALYEDWVKHLRLVNSELVGAIKEMQDTCSDRLELMRANYKKNLARFGPEKLQRLESDRDSLIEVIRRASATGKWNMNGIKLCDVSLDQLFGKTIDINTEAPVAGKIEGPTISLNLEVSSNCQLENTEVEQLLQELEAKKRQIKRLELLLEQQIPTNYSRSNDMESDLLSDDCATINEPLINQLRQVIGKKDEKLQQKCAQIGELSKEITSLKSKIEEMDLSSQFDSDLTQSLAEFKIEDTDASNRKLLQQLQNTHRVKSEQLESVNRENEELRRHVESLQAMVPKQSLALAALPEPASKLQKSVSNPNMDTASISSCESIISFISVSSDSSSATVKAPKTMSGSEQEPERIKHLRSELAIMSQQLQLFEQTKLAQANIIAEQNTRLDATGAELKKMCNDYGNNKKKLCFIRAEIMGLIEQIVNNLKGHFKLPATVQSIDSFVSQPMIGNTSSEDQCSKDAALLECLKQYLDAIVKSYIVVTKEREELCKLVDLLKEQLNASRQEKEQFRNAWLATGRKPSPETKEKETSIDFDIMPAPVDTRETLAAQRMRVQTVLRDMAVEIACLIGTNLSSDTLSSISELDATPLHYLITDLKKEIKSKDQVLIDRRGYIEQLEHEVLVKEKELHRLELRQKAVDNDRLSYEKRIANLQRALQDHDEAIDALKQDNLDLQQHLEDMKNTLQTYKESIRRLGDEKANLEDECNNQLITISNLRTALEETKRSGSASVSLPSFLGGSSSTSPIHSGPNSQYLQPQHHYYTSNNTNNSNINSNNNTSSGTSYWSAFWRAMHDS